MTSAIDVRDVSYFYGQRQALRSLGLQIEAGEIFAFLGPNGGGKTTLFRLLSTLIPIQHGEVRILGYDPRHDRQRVRERIGVVFQAPSLDKKLTVVENIRHQAALYGLFGKSLRERENQLLRQLGLSDRARERTETLSGGLRRRVELAKGMIHMPRLLLLDEPSTGLDPGARIDLWAYLQHLRDEFGVTVVLTTHLLEEAEKADRLAILHQGELVALGSPNELRETVGGDSITIDADNPEELAAGIIEKFEIKADTVDGQVRLEQPNGHQWVARIVEAFPECVHSIRLGKPTLEDVFIDKTGHRFWHGEGDDESVVPEGSRHG
jgi:ABC-2 type transport system ATP-binding protein